MRARLIWDQEAAGLSPVSATTPGMALEFPTPGTSFRADKALSAWGCGHKAPWRVPRIGARTAGETASRIWPCAESSRARRYRRCASLGADHSIMLLGCPVSRAIGGPGQPKRPVQGGNPESTGDSRKDGPPGRCAGR